MMNEPTTPSMEDLAAFYKDAVRRCLNDAGHWASSYLIWAETGDKLKIASIAAMQELHDMLRAHFDRQAGAAIAAARTQAIQLRYERRILGYSRMILDRMAEYENLTPFDQGILRREAADAAQAIVDEIGHPVTDEPALGPDLRARVAELEALLGVDMEQAWRRELARVNLMAMQRGRIQDLCHRTSTFIGGAEHMGLPPGRYVNASHILEALEYELPATRSVESGEASTDPFDPTNVIHDDGESKWIKFPWDDAKYTADQARSRAAQLIAAADRIDSLNLPAAAALWPVGTPVWFRRYGDGPWELSKTINLPWTKNGVTYVTVDSYPPQAGAARRVDNLRTVDDPPADTEPAARPI